MQRIIRRLASVSNSGSRAACGYFQPRACLSSAASAAGKQAAARDSAPGCRSAGACNAVCTANKTPDYQQCCWSCGTCTNKAALFCATCAYIQPVNGSANYFELLELPQSYDVALSQLEANFKRLQKTVHPDLYGSKSKKEQEVSASASSVLNVAYRVLRDPAARAQYMLRLHGLDALGERAGRDNNVSPELLMQIMEARELLSDDSGADSAAVRQLAARTEEAVASCLADLRGAFAGHNLDAARSITVALQYYTKLQSEIGEWLEAHSGKQRQRMGGGAESSSAGSGAGSGSGSSSSGSQQGTQQQQASCSGNTANCSACR